MSSSPRTFDNLMTLIKDKFYLPCGNRVDKEPPSFEGLHNPQERWNGWTTPLFTYEEYQKIVNYYSDKSTNNKEDIEYLEDFFNKETSKCKKQDLYSFGSYCLCWSCESED
jgi:hypothetical protein